MKVYTTLEAWQKMSLWAALGGRKHREFTCFGRAVHEDGDFRVTDVYLVKQEGSAGGVDGDDADINRLMVDLYMQGIEPDEAFRCWIHSHPGTGPTATYLSGTDEENIGRYLTGAFLISIVLDSKGDNPYCRIDVKEPRMSIRADLKVELPTMDAEIRKNCEEEFEEKSSSIVWTPHHYAGGKRSNGWPVRGDEYEDAYYGAIEEGSSYRGYRGSYYYRGTDNGMHDGKVTQLTGNDGGRGKANGATPVKAGGGAVKGGNDIVGRPEYDSTEELLLYGMDSDEYEAWLEYLNQEELDDSRANGSPSRMLTDDTEELSIHEVEEEVVPEWVVSMADSMACTVEVLQEAINIIEYDAAIDDIVFQIQCGYKSLDDAISDLEGIGIEKAIAQKELNTRINA